MLIVTYSTFNLYQANTQSGNTADSNYHYQHCHCYVTWQDNNCYWNDWTHIYSSQHTHKKAQVL